MENKIFELEKELKEIKDKSIECLTESGICEIDKKIYETLIKRQEKYIHDLKNLDKNILKGIKI